MRSFMMQMLLQNSRVDAAAQMVDLPAVEARSKSAVRPTFFLSSQVLIQTSPRLGAVSLLSMLSGTQNVAKSLGFKDF